MSNQASHRVVRSRLESSLRTAAGVLSLGALLVATPALARPQPDDPGAAIRERLAAPAQPVDELAPAVRDLLGAAYLTDEERRALRVTHGVWEPSDLTTPAERARAALACGAYHDAAFNDEGVPALDRAEAALGRGDPEGALVLSADAPGARAARLRAEALVQLGHVEDALPLLDAAVQRLGAERVDDAAELTELVRCAVLRSRFRPLEGGAAGFQSLMGALARAREELDKLDARPPLVEAALLYDKDNPGEAGPALQAALLLHPRLAEAHFLVGQMAVQAFDLSAAEEIGARLDALARSLDPEGAPKRSAMGAMVVARARMRQNDADDAVRLLDEALEASPRHRGLLALRAAAAALQFRDADAQARLDAFDQLAPGSAEAYLEAGRVMSGARQYEIAARYLAEAARRAPFWCEPVIEWGLVDVQAGRDREALAALERAVALDPFNQRAGNSLKLMRDLSAFATIETPHFIVRYQPGVDAVLAEEMPEALEELYKRVTGNERGGISFEPKRKTIIELMPDHRWFAVRITGMPAVHTIAASTGPIIAMEAPKEGPAHLLGAYDWVRVVRHEFTHTVTLARTSNRLPHWFTEAAAVYLEDAPRDFSAARLLAAALEGDALFDFDEINLAFVRPTRPSDRAQAYAQGHWMYEYMVERFGAQAPLALMDQYATGAREAEAFPKVLKVTREEFLTEFKEWAKGQVEAWGMRPEPSIPDLLRAARPTPPTPPDRHSAAVEPLPEPTPELVASWLEKMPAHPDVLKLAIDQALEAAGGQPQPSMIPLLRRYAAARPVDPFPHKLLASLALAGQLGDPDEVIPHLEYLDVREQHSAGFAVELARRYAARQDWERAWAKAQRATQIAPFNASHRELAATVALKRRDFDAAERHLRALTRLEPDREIHRTRLDALQKLKGEQLR